MKRGILLLFLVSIVVFPAFAQQKKGIKRGGNCFCDAAAKKNMGIYTGFNANFGLYSFHPDYKIRNKTALSPGWQFGVNITKNISFETGFSYTKLVKVDGPYESFANMPSSYTYYDVPVSLIFRFPNDNNGLIPYIGIGGVNNFMKKVETFSPGQNVPLSSATNVNYYDFFLQFKAGTNFVLSDHISIFGGFLYRRNVRPYNANEGTAHLNYNQLFSVESGINFHF